MRDDSAPLPYWTERGRRVLFVTYKGDCRYVRLDGRELLFTTHTLADVFACVRPGDILQLLPGKYWPPILYDEDSGAPPSCRPVKIADIHGSPDMPVTIRGLGAATALNGGLGGVPHDSMLPEMKHFAFFKLADCSWIEFENLAVESCWPTFLYMEDSSYVSVRRVRATDSRYLVYARGQGCHHILLEENHWRQDPTGAMWRDQLWLDSKRKRYFYCNGGLFGSVGVAGSVVLRGNTICDAFNGMRMKTEKKKETVQNCNVEIYSNTLLRIRDNPVEPERGATNWWVHHNRIHNAHAWFSLDEVTGGFWYFFANTGWITDKPGTPLDPNRGGKVYKYDATGLMPDGCVLACNNSYKLCNSLVKGGATTHLTHRNNAVLFRDEPPEGSPVSDRADCPLPEAVRRPFADGCRGEAKEGDDRFVGDGFMPDGWVEGVSFDCDLTNLPWPPKITDNAQERSGVVDPDASFVDAPSGDLRLVGGPRPGCRVVLKAVEDWPGETDWDSGENTPIGAYDVAGRLVAGPPFVFLRPKSADEGYVEMPRLVRLEAFGRGQLDAGGIAAELRLTFSTPLAEGGPVRARVVSGGQEAWVECARDGRVLRGALPNGLGVEREPGETEDAWAGVYGLKLDAVLLPDDLKGANGEYVTLWSSVFAGLGFYATGETPRVKPPEVVCFCNCGEE
ncbi:right-handed parallel beta-helix repeat-containing protein [Fundidesulfovibrio soli]|uniref:right-handed parallel beta-helix repeat-containing protein n=1 Tax=Fundidesulfovibrio soli TaxID=2922716 RepID=UPI001FAEB073|nr:right-handed parallel beta-helix repeat-containing protein [Fundidesulfovibrio soli]